MSLFHDSSSLVTILCVFASLVWRVEGYSDTSCCETADSKFPGAFVNTTVHPLTSNVICGQTYSKTTPPAPNAWVSYDFCTANCAGIGLSRPSDTGAWIGPLVQFILPAVLFSATIPRRKVLTFWALDKWAWEFIEGRRYLEILTFVPRKVWSAVVAVLDSSAWVIVIVTAAGPMLVGGLYEALFDHLILKTLRESAAEDDSSPEDVKVHLQLLVIMALGNLREDGDPIENTIAKLSVASGQHASAKKEQQEHSKTRLQALMSAQLPFGTAIGAPVLFYLGAFVFTVVDLLNDPSDENSAISLAFGVEWMIIVHVAIVAGCLLASNNPSTSTAIVGKTSGTGVKDETVVNRSTVKSVNAAGNMSTAVFGHNPAAIFAVTTEANAEGTQSKLRAKEKASRNVTFTNAATSVFFHSRDNLQWLFDWVDRNCFSNAYDTTFQPVSIWYRGANKREKLTYRDERRKSSQATASAAVYEINRGIVNVSWWWWPLIWTFTLILIALPASAAAVVSFATPPVGWGCRSLSMTLYASCQMLLSTQYMIRHWVRYEKRVLPPPNRWYQLLNPSINFILKVLSSNYWNVFPLFISFFMSIGGTAMQIIGVLRNCFCYVNTPMWLDLGHAVVNVANDTEQARKSNRYWIIMGSVATAFMVGTAYAGWWYQDYVKQRFLDAVDRLYDDEPSKKTAAKHTSSSNFIRPLGRWWERHWHRPVVKATDEESRSLSRRGTSFYATSFQSIPQSPHDPETGYTSAHEELMHVPKDFSGSVVEMENLELQEHHRPLRRGFTTKF